MYRSRDEYVKLHHHRKQACGCCVGPDDDRCVCLEHVKLKGPARRCTFHEKECNDLLFPHFKPPSA